MTYQPVMALNFSSASLEEFELYAKRAKALGATHVYVSEMPKGLWMWEDRNDPYPNWSMHHCQLFGLVIPPALEGFLPTDFVKERFSLLKARCSILDRLGLRGAIRSNEPFWLPEAVYEAHPAWRGARCDHPRRSRNAYWSPCVDHPEVLAMYSHAMEVLARESCVDLYFFMSNDSGGGICWSSGLYTGPNGPAACQNRDMGARIAGFMDALSEGARRGGREATLWFNANLGFKAPEEQLDQLWPRLKEGQIVNLRDRDGAVPVAQVFTREGYLNPVKSLPLVMQFAKSLHQARQSGRPILTLQMPKSDLDAVWVYLEAYKENPSRGYADVVALAKRTARNIAGEAAASSLVDLWQHFDDALVHLTHLGLDMMQYGTLHQRWLNRPFVPYPLELNEEEKSYYRPFQFQAQDEHHAADLMDIQGIEAIRGFAGSFLATESLRRARESLSLAQSALDKTLSQSLPEVKAGLEMLRLRIKVLDGFFITMIHAIRMQELLDRAPYGQIPRSECRWPTKGDQDLQALQTVMRAEIDNALNLADLLEGRVSGLLSAEDSESLEDIFHFGPHLPQQLRLKARVMLRHIRDAERLYETNNI